MKAAPQAKPQKRPKIEQSVAHVSRCKKCGSTRRTSYHSRRELAFAGEDRDGTPFTHVVWRRTACLDCGQARVDRHYENRRSKARKK